MGQARTRALHGTPSIGNDWKWAQRDFEERPVQFHLRNKYVDPVLKKLNRLLSRVGKKHEATSPKAVLSLALLFRQAEKYQKRIDIRRKQLAPLA